MGCFFALSFSNDSDTFEKMKHLKVKTTPCIYLMAITVFHFSCTPSKKQSHEPEKKLPGTVAITPSSFRCSGSVIESKPESVSLVVNEIKQRGSSLFYAVNPSDTIEAVFLSPTKNKFPSGSLITLLIEERLKMNSEKPEFVVKNIE